MQGLDNVGLKETVAITCWYLWWLRRRRTHNEAVPPINRCKMSILTMAANQANSFKPEGASSEIKWTRPEPRHLKLNVDASFYADSCSGATGAVLRDYQGQFVAASTRFLPNIASIAMAEAVAMKEGLALASRLGCNAIIAESDSTDTIEACTELNTWWNGSAAIFADIVDLASTIDSVEYRYVPREANMTAHEIARQGFIDKINCNWDDDPPSFLLSFLIHDVTTGD
jgi:ribonuclease HI